MFFLSFFFLQIYLFYLFIFGCVGSSLLLTGFLQLRRVGATLRCGARASHCGGFSCGVWALGTRASVAVAHGLSSCGSRALERRLSSWGARAQLLCGMWDPPGPGLEPIVPCVGRWILNHCATREDLLFVFVPHTEQGLRKVSDNYFKFGLVILIIG